MTDSGTSTRCVTFRRDIGSAESVASFDAAPALSIVVPVCNESSTLPFLVARVRTLPLSNEILLIDDGSTDGTSRQVTDLARLPGITGFYHRQNLGKGAAIRTALRHVTGEVIVIQDADLEYDPAEIASLIQPIVDGQADVVYGSRFAKRRQDSSRKTAKSQFGHPEVCRRVLPAARASQDSSADLRMTRGERRPDSSRWSHRLANRFLTWLSNRFTGLRLTDMETCYKAMRREVATGLALRENRFGFEPEFTAKIARRGWRVVEAPISYNPRNRSAGKKIGIRDGLRAVWCIVRYSRWD